MDTATQESVLANRDAESFGVQVRKRRGLTRRLLRHRSGRIGATILGLVIAIGAIGPFVVQHSRSASAHYQNLEKVLQAPTLQHPLGTDEFGRDETVRLINGTRYTVGLAVAAVLLGVLIGAPIGAVSGYAGGWFDSVTQRVVDVLMSFPSFLLALGLIAAMGPGLRSLIVAVGVGSVPRIERLMRASVLRTRELLFVEAAHALGAGPLRILRKHVVPNSVTPVLVQLPLELSTAILTIAGLGFFGLGVQPPTPEWGAMLGEARNYIFSNVRLIALPGICIFAVALGANLVGDAVADMWEPKSIE